MLQANLGQREVQEQLAYKGLLVQDQPVLPAILVLVDQPVLLDYKVLQVQVLRVPPGWMGQREVQGRMERQERQGLLAVQDLLGRLATLVLLGLPAISGQLG